MTTKAGKQNFEEAFNALQAVVEKLESDDISLEEALQAYEKGIRLIQQCAAILEQAQLRIEQLSKDEAGQFHLEDISPSINK